jgi:hypothetical protein
MSGNVSIMKSPVGDVEFCESTVRKRVQTAIAITKEISELPDEHLALNLLRYQTGRMEYISRTTPQSSCQRGLTTFDAAVRGSFGTVLNLSCTEGEWQQAVLPTRYSGLGFRSAAFNADPAYVASRASTATLCAAIWGGFHISASDPVREATARINSRFALDAPALVVEDGLQQIPKQRNMSDKLAAAECARLKAAASPFHSARLNGFSATGANRWLAATPSRTLDKHLTSGELVASISLTLGVDVFGGDSLCRYCAAVLDTKGIHPSSCMAGGDCTLRHNEVRDCLFKYALRGRLNPELEKAGILNEDAILVSLRRPADVLMDDPGRGHTKVALDVKVINALGQDHLNATLLSPLGAADAYRERSLEHQDTARRCAERGVHYEPVVFTAQGGIQSHAESVINKIAAAIAKVEGKPLGHTKAELVQDISRILARATARAVIRRAPRLAAEDARESRQDGEEDMLEA